jgi:hypothetical protein
MKQAATFIMIILLSAGQSIPAESQNAPQIRDKYILLTTPYNQRPITLYRGQIRANAGYKFAVRSQSFNSDGSLVYLKDNGTGSVYHYYFLELKYGLTNFIETGVETNFLRRGIRDATTTVVSTTLASTERVTVNKLTESKGMGDIFLFAEVRLPIKFKWFDFGIKGGLFLPSAKYETQQPSNTVVSSLTASSTYTVNLHYNYKNGYGIPVYLVAAASKISYKRFTIECEWTYQTPMKEGHNIRWEETLADKAFSYYDKSYSYLLSNTYNIDASLHYQATGWFNLSMNTSFFRTKGGWTEYWGNKYSNPEKRLMNLEPGFELQISPSITVYQVAGFPLNGKNSDAPFYLFTTFSFNMFPFLR